MKTKRWTKEQRKEHYRRGMFIIPSFFTVGNIFCGFFSISSAIRGNFELAGILVLIAIILDTLDGRIARMTKTNSEFGVQLDSLADVITFGVAPAVLCYQWAFYNYESRGIDRAGWLVCFLFIICAASRLARFNIQAANAPDKRYFIGLPSPAAAATVASTIYCFPERLEGNVPALVALAMTSLLAFLMVSRIKYRSFKDLNLRQPHSYRIVVVVALIFTAMAMDMKRALITLTTIYTFSGLVGMIVAARKKTPVEVPDPASAPTHP